MMLTDITEEVFDLALTPDTATQYQFSNWVHRGQGKNLVEAYANHCNCEVGTPFIRMDNAVVETLPKKYITLDAGYKQGHARYYCDWPELVKNLTEYYEDATIVQVGTEESPLIEGTLDLRGKTNVNELAAIIKNSCLHVGIDSFPMHVAAWNSVPVVAIFGSSYANSTGPYTKKEAEKKQKFILLESENRLGCDKACYKSTCKVNKNMPCVNEIDSYEIFQACVALLKE
jgi:ADP-heptose:LPS heptosyltransferase